ncbi:MAG: transglutaminase domain-containing protein [Acidimicrobiaceae bacterium]|nr:transglutaminase domain-containing protein [Acidimicrobiaceae bacterium]
MNSARPASGGRRGAAYDWLSEAALVSVTVVVGAGMSRLFTDGSFLPDVLALAVVAHVIAAAARRARLPVPVAGLVCGASLAVSATVLLYPETAWIVLPTVDTVGAARDHLVDAWSVVNASSAPVVPAPGLVLIAAAALAAGAFLADTAAFRMGAAVPEAERIGGSTRLRRARPWPERPVSAANKNGNYNTRRHPPQLHDPVTPVSAANKSGNYNSSTRPASIYSRPVLAVVPASAVYGFTAAAGTGDGAVRHGALFSGAVGATMVALWLRNRRADAWIEPGPGQGAAAMARAGAAALTLAVVAGAVAGPRLPGASAAPWVDLAEFEVTDAAPWVDRPSPPPEPWADFELQSTAAVPMPGSGNPDGPRVLVSPLVQVRSRLVELSDRELFTVEVLQDERQYWRLTSLDEFDGNGWGARSDYADAIGPLAGTIDAAAAGGAAIVQTVSLSGLGNSYLPAAFEPRRVIDDGGVALEYETASGSLIKARSAALGGPSRFTYSVESVVPAVGDPDRLRSVDTSALDADFLAVNTQLPDDARQVVLTEAQRVTAGSRSDYHRALLLQDYFRLDGGFRYDLQVHSDQGTDSLEEFLFDVRAGYCQQFATAYAAMARSVGLPTRVAVGFTWGEWDAARGEQGAYVVRGKHAHAWPEVYFAGTGWVRFEPTPGRGAPGDFAITGHVANQAGLRPPGGLGALPLDAASSGVSGDAAGAGFAGLRSPLDQDAAPGSDASARSAGAGDSAGPFGRGVPRLVAVGVLVLAAAALALGSVPVLRRLDRRRVRARLADDPAGLIEEWWGDALEALALAGLAPRTFETPLELARRVAAARGEVGPVSELATLATHGRYAPRTSPSMAVRAGVLGSRVVAACRRQARMSSRLVAAFDPSTLLTRRRRR